MVKKEGNDYVSKPEYFFAVKSEQLYLSEAWVEIHILLPGPAGKAVFQPEQVGKTED